MVRYRSPLATRTAALPTALPIGVPKLAMAVYLMHSLFSSKIFVYWLFDIGLPVWCN